MSSQQPLSAEQEAEALRILDVLKQTADQDLMAEVGAAVAQDVAKAGNTMVRKPLRGTLIISCSS